MSPLPEIAITPEEFAFILKVCNGNALLVGGQSLAFWASHFNAATPVELSVCVTMDVDFLGNAAAARALAHALKPFGWTCFEPSPYDATPQTAKLSKVVEGQGIKQIDFIDSIIGLPTEAVRRRAVNLTHESGAPMIVLHSLDVLESRLKNIDRLAQKRTAQYFAQAHLAVTVAGCYVKDLIAQGDLRKALDSIERLAQIAQDRSLQRVILEHDVDPLQAVPFNDIPSENFKSKRWPQIEKATKHIRDSALARDRLMEERVRKKAERTQDCASFDEQDEQRPLR